MEFLEIFEGLLLLLFFHVLAGVIIFVLGLILGSVSGNATLVVWVVGGRGFLFWQLLYGIPLTIWLNDRGKIGMMKGVIIGAALTALLNGMCFLLTSQ